MIECVIGSTGFIGAELSEMIGPECIRASRSGPRVIDFLTCRVVDIPPCDVAYLCTGLNGAYPCAQRPYEAFLINAYAPVEIAKVLESSFVVYISSMSVEWNEGIYTTTKKAAESALSKMPNVGIVRAGRVLRSNVRDLCKTLLKVGRERIAGVTRWGSDEIAYAK